LELNTQLFSQMMVNDVNHDNEMACLGLLL